MKVGDIVLVDCGFANGGYRAEIVWLGKLIALIKAGDSQWNIMRYRLTEIPKNPHLEKQG